MSTKLMAKLAKVQGLESGSAAVLVDQNFCLDGRQNGGKPAEFHCVYLEQLLGEWQFIFALWRCRFAKLQSVISCWIFAVLNGMCDLVGGA